MPTAFQRVCKIEKIDEEQRMVFGWFSEIEVDGETVIDADDDYIVEADLEKSAYDFVLNVRAAGEKHKLAKRKKVDGVVVSIRKKKKVIGRLVESMVFTKEKQELLGIDLGRVGWFGGFLIDDESAWAGVKSGKYTAFSLGGTGTRIEEAA